jgi:UDP-3-O-acyl-N-acetylglucosamine deacetylase
MPGCDGSSQAFVTAILLAGSRRQDALRQRLEITDVTRVGSEDCWVEARPARSPGLSLKYKLDYNGQGQIGRQTLDLVITPESFQKELASARTFLLQPEADWLRQRGLGARVTSRDVLIFGDDGLVNNELRFEDECVRHKTLDLLGDLALAGCDLVGRVVAYRSGHRLNADLVKALLPGVRARESRRKTA